MNKSNEELDFPENNEESELRVCVYFNKHAAYVASSRIQDFTYECIGIQSLDFRKKTFLLNQEDGNEKVVQILAVERKYF